MKRDVLNDRDDTRTARTLPGPVLAGFETEHRRRGGRVPADAPRAEMPHADIFERFREFFGDAHA